MKKGPKTKFVKKEEAQRNWYIMDVSGKVLGRVATKIAAYLRGKHKPQFTPHVDCGDFIIVINAEKIRVTGSKEEQKIYFRHSDYPGGARYTPFTKTDPAKVIEHAVRGMLPKNRLGRKMFGKLKVYKGAKHPHLAQQAKNLEV